MSVWSFLHSIKWHEIMHMGRQQIRVSPEYVYQQVFACRVIKVIPKVSLDYDLTLFCGRAAGWSGDRPFLPSYPELIHICSSSMVEVLPQKLWFLQLLHQLPDLCKGGWAQPQIVGRIVSSLTYLFQGCWWMETGNFWVMFFCRTPKLWS